MKGGKFKIEVKPFGQKAMLIQWPQEINTDILDDVMSFMEVLKSGFSTDWEYVPAYNSLLITNAQERFDQKRIVEKIRSLYAANRVAKKVEKHIWKFPVCYEGSYGIDLKEASKTLALSIDDIISLHTATIYTLFGIGFLPGFMYLGGLPKELEMPRRKEPRLKVDAGSVGLAAKQTGIYPQQSPGGWNIIGKCPIPMFDIRKSPPCYVSVGDKVSFYSISQKEMDHINIQVEVGIYEPQIELWHAKGDS